MDDMINEKKEQYMQLLNDLNIIRTKFYRLNDIYNNMISIQNQTFTIDRKIEKFLQTSLRIYKVPEKKIIQTIEFINEFNMKDLANNEKINFNLFGEFILIV